MLRINWLAFQQFILQVCSSLHDAATPGGGFVTMGLNCSPFQVAVVRYQRMIVSTVSKWILDLLQFLVAACNETEKHSDTHSEMKLLANVAMSKNFPTMFSMTESNLGPLSYHAAALPLSYN
ncbi:hypothetical protein OUZ56_020931 [Daphnia magna]|uniref:Uncharacterized protein n=1 Tax=Daphnia magna TaxID=35525 RepID=A0ABQ9ZFX4_9CRUS|nr:hypothetical protein OUZ56_020931 [Daphnia magna]